MSTQHHYIREDRNTERIEELNNRITKLEDEITTVTGNLGMRALVLSRQAVNDHVRAKHQLGRAIRQPDSNEGGYKKRRKSSKRKTKRRRKGRKTRRHRRR